MTKRPAFIITVRDEDGTWFLESAQLPNGRSCWVSTRQDAMHFLTRGYAEYVASCVKFNDCEWSPRSRIRVREV